MKIALVGPVYPYRGGIAHYTTQLALSLRSNGHECKVVSFRRQYPAWLYPGGSDKDPSLSSVQLDADFVIDPFYPWTWSRAGKHILQQAPHMVLLQWWSTYWTMPFAWLGRQLCHAHVPVIYLVHNVFPHEEKPWDRWLTKYVLAPADGFILQTQSERDRLLTVLPDALNEVSPHPSYSMLTRQRVDKLSARERLGLPLEEPVLLFFGLIRPYKGLKYLIEALSILKSNGVKPILLVAGDFWQDRNIYQQQILDCGLSEQIRLDDRYIPDEDAALMFSAADVLVAPYVGGTQSGVAGLALGFGLPIIASDLVSKGLSETNPENLWVVPRGDACALADAIREFLTSREQGSTTPVEAIDNWWRMVDTIEKMYDRLKQRV